THQLSKSYRAPDGDQPAQVVKNAKAPRRRGERQEPPVRPRVAEGPVGEVEMTREELKALIREAMDEERGGGPAPLAPKWEGGVAVLKPADPAVHPQELPGAAGVHKVVMAR